MQIGWNPGCDLCKLDEKPKYVLCKLDEKPLLVVLCKLDVESGVFYVN